MEAQLIKTKDAAASERQKYEEIWGHKEYRDKSPGLENVERFMSVMKPEKGETLIDIGCGSGVAGLEFERLGLDVWYLDITDAGLEQKVNRKRFIRQPLWEEWRHFGPDGMDGWNYGWRYGFCCDVMEHIPTEYSMLVVDRILRSCGTTWFHIAMFRDGFGKMIGKPLHLTVKPYSWWLEHIGGIGNILDARDLCGMGLFVVESK